MTQTITAYDLIRRSMYLINALASGEQITNAQDANDALITLNELLDSWSTEALSVYSGGTQDLIVTPGKTTYTIGESGADIVSTRPVWFNNAICVRNGVTTPIKIITQDEYDSISVKAISQPLIERALYINDNPNGRFILWPIPTEAVTFTFNTNRLLTTPANLSTLIVMPPGYQRALRYCLAVELWPEYNNPSTDINTIKAIALKAKANVKIANMDDILSSFADVPAVEAGRSWDWREG